MGFISNKNNFIEAILNYNEIYSTGLSTKECILIDYDSLFSNLFKDTEFNSLKYVCNEEELVEYIYKNYINKKAV